MRLFQASLLLASLPILPGVRVPGPAAAPAATSLEAALDTIQPDDIRADLTFIASDELGGRDTPSQGLRLAARYIQARLARLGFRPSGEDGGYLDPYALRRLALDLERTHAVVSANGSEQELAFGEDYGFFGAADLDVEGPVVFVGRGTADEVAGLDLTGKFALCYRDDSLDRRVREETLRSQGAAGIIQVSPPGDEDPVGQRIRRYARWMSRGSLRLGEDEVFPSVSLTREAAQHLLPESVPPVVGQELGARFRDVRALSADSQTYEVENVAALWPGSDPTLSHEVLIVSAHYDHVGTDEQGRIFNGADDNGSGTCGLLALADALSSYGPMRRSVLLLWVSGEEKGLLGSEAWTKHPTLPEGFHPVADLNIDMIGRNAPDKLLITPTRDHEAYNFLTKMAERFAPAEGFASLGSADDYWNRSDHANFSANLGIPVAFLFSDVHEDYHQPTDTVDKIDFDKIRRVTRLVFRMLAELQSEHLGA